MNVCEKLCFVSDCIWCIVSHSQSECDIIEPIFGQPLIIIVVLSLCLLSASLVAVISLALESLNINVAAIALGWIVIYGFTHNIHR